MPVCRCGSSTVTTRRPLPSVLLWTGSFIAGRRRIRSGSCLCNGGGAGALDHGRRGQPQREGGPRAGRALAGELAAVLLGHLLRQRQAEARAPLLGGEEGVENAL